MKRQEYFLYAKKPKRSLLFNKQQKELDSEITIHELSKAVEQFYVAKAPGIDGFPKEFYKHVWNVIKEDMLEVFKESFE